MLTIKTGYTETSDTVYTDRR